MSRAELDAAELAVAAALRYAARGWAVFPLVARGKTPMIPSAHPVGDPLHGRCKGGCGRLGHGFHDATSDPAVVRRWWCRWPCANIGVATGAASGVDVLDVDPKNGGGGALQGLLDVHGSLPRTLTARTGSGGAHYLFSHVAGRRRSLGFRPGLDLLADDAYCVVAPSVHPCGAPYRWIEAAMAVADAPSWLVEAAMSSLRPAAPSTGFRSPPIPASSRGTRYGSAAVERASMALANAAQGSRNHRLNATAFQLARLAAAGHLAADHVAQALVEASRANGYFDEVGEPAVRRVIACAFAAGDAAGPRGPTLPWARRSGER